MKIWRFLSPAAMFFALSASAHIAEWTEDYSVSPDLATELTEDENAFADEQYRWLYELLFPEQTRRSFPSESFKSFRVHLKDSNQNFPRSEEIALKNLSGTRRIEGTITYAGIVKKKYATDVVFTSPASLILNVRVHLRGANPEDKLSFRRKIREAQALWNSSRVATDFAYSFQFDLVENKSEAHFSVNVLDSTRGPYDTNWGRNWTSTVIAHEIGHMMGLGDEYQTITGKIDCLRGSLMCDSWTGWLMKHHYYFVLRRLIR